jgi:hypothetical protein
MSYGIRSFVRAALVLALASSAFPLAAQTRRQQAERELARKMPAGSVAACSLVTRTR